MTKSFRISSPSSSNSAIISTEVKEKLFELMDVKGISLIQASNQLKLPYKVAKQILFTQRKKLSNKNKSKVEKLQKSKQKVRQMPKKTKESYPADAACIYCQTYPENPSTPYY